MIKPYLEAGEFTTTHGITGELRLYPWCDGPEFLSTFTTLYLDDRGRKPLYAEQIRPHKNICIVRLKNVSTVEEAHPYIGKTVYIAREDACLPKGRYFVQDLLGAHLRDADTGEEYGEITAITRPGRHDVYEVTRPNGTTALFPACEPFLVAVHPEEGLVQVRPIPGMLEEEAPKKPEKPSRRRREQP